MEGVLNGVYILTRSCIAEPAHDEYGDDAKKFMKDGATFVYTNVADFAQREDIQQFGGMAMAGAEKALDLTKQAWNSQDAAPVLGKRDRDSNCHLN